MASSGETGQVRPDDESDDQRRVRRSPSLVVGVVAALALVVTAGLFLATDSTPVPETGTVLLLPSEIPDNLALGGVNTWNALGSQIDPGRATSVNLYFDHPDGSSSNEEASPLTVEVEDRLAVTETRLEHDFFPCLRVIDGEEVRVDDECRRRAEESQCSGVARIEEGRLDAESCISEHIANLESIPENPPEGVELGDLPELTFTRITVRGRPALLVEAVDYGTSIMTIEGGGVVSIVTGTSIPEEAVVAFAESLQPGSAAEFDEYVGDL